MHDNLFEPESLAVKPHEIVRFVLVNKGELLHEFNIGTTAMHAKHQEEMAMMMEYGMLTATGMNHDMSKTDPSKMAGMNMDDMKHNYPNSVLVEPGKTGENWFASSRSRPSLSSPAMFPVITNLAWLARSTSRSENGGSRQ